MIAKISKGGSFGGAVDYVLDKGKDAELLAGLGVRMKDRDSIVRSFRMQAALNPHLSKPVGHIVLAFSAQDAARLDNRRMVGIAAEYLSGMGIRNTQFIIARHRDREHPHLHILFNRVDNDGRTVSNRNTFNISENNIFGRTKSHLVLIKNRNISRFSILKTRSNSGHQRIAITEFVTAGVRYHFKTRNSSCARLQ